MMTISDDSRMRVFTYVQQMDVPFVQVGDRAVISDAANPERKKVGDGHAHDRRARASDAHHADRGASRQRGRLLHARQLRLCDAARADQELHRRSRSTALITRGEDNIVGVLDNDVVRFRTVTVASTDGATVSLPDGLKPGERIAINLPNEVTNGSRVQPVTVARNAVIVTLPRVRRRKPIACRSRQVLSAGSRSHDRARPWTETTDEGLAWVVRWTAFA